MKWTMEKAYYVGADDNEQVILGPDPLDGEPVRIANVYTVEDAKLMVKAPELSEALHELLEALRFSRLPKVNVKKDFSLLVAMESARTVLRAIEE